MKCRIPCSAFLKEPGNGVITIRCVYGDCLPATGRRSVRTQYNPSPVGEGNAMVLADKSRWVRD